MISDYLFPVGDTVLAHTVLLSEQSLGRQIKKHTKQDGVPSVEGVQIALLGVEEGRRAVDNEATGKGVDQVRLEFYKLFSGSWTTNIVDLGNIPKGNEVTDTYFALSEIVAALIKKNIIPIIIGGGQDLTYANYRAYDSLERMVNLVSVDNKFDFGPINESVTSQSYMTSIVMDQPTNLFNYSNVGYQTFFNPQEQIDLINDLFFDAYRLGEVSNKLELVEPLMRDADLVSIDIGVLRKTEGPGNNNSTPNGLYGEQLCAISRYAGISDKVSSFGVYEYNHSVDNRNQTAQLIAQVLWYFIEGVNCRTNDYPFGTKEQYQKFIVPIEDEVLNFYKSNKSDRWWVEINLSLDNNKKRLSLIPCTYEDYLSANEQEIPDRWFKTMKKVV